MKICGAMLNPITLINHPKYRGLPLNEVSNRIARDGWRYYTDLNKFVKVVVKDGDSSDRK